MKKLIAILFFTGILLQTFNQVVIVAQYYACKNYIAKNLCENRDKPMMHCDGKCCLRKRLARQGKEQAPNSQNQKSEQVNLFYADNNFEIMHLPIIVVPNSYFSYNDLKTSSFPHTVFHPPTA